MGSAGRGIDLKTNKGTGGYFAAAFFAFGLRSKRILELLAYGSGSMVLIP